jgi:N-acetyl-anhydromuramyl-L-alanine amidase AmpD
MSEKTHELQSGESIASVAAKYGVAISVLSELNEAVIAQRGGAEGLKPGDTLTVSRETGSKNVGTGRTHDIVASRPPKLFELRVYTQFRLSNEKGDKPVKARWRDGPAVMLATAKFIAAGRDVRSGKTSKRALSLPKTKGQTPSVGRGTLRVEKLEDGIWTLELEPQPEELSTGRAGPDPDADHGLGFWVTEGGSLKAHNNPSKQPPMNGQWEIEYRPLKIMISIQEGAILHASVFDERDSTAYPLHAALFWKKVPASDDPHVEQILEVDWKPDFIRRVVLTSYQIKMGPRAKAKNRKGEEYPSPRAYIALSPFQKARQPLASNSRRTPYEETLHGIEALVFHQTTGNEPGGALNTFLNNYNEATAEIAGKMVEGDQSLHSGAHFLVDRDGHVIRMADDRYYTQHAGGKFRYKKRSGKRSPLWGGDRRNTNVNDRALGIENCHGDINPDHDLEICAFTEAQYEAMFDLSKRIQKVYGVRKENVIGHQDATGKVRCPGPRFDWKRFEDAGISLKVAELTEPEIETMFGGFFAGDDGKKRRIEVGDRFEGREDGTFALVRKKKEIVSGLAGSPSELLYETLINIGYAPFPDNVWPDPEPGKRVEYGMNAAYCIGQFIRHFFTAKRYNHNRKHELAYKHAEVEFFIDLNLATQIAGAAKSL